MQSLVARNAITPKNGRIPFSAVKCINKNVFHLGVFLTYKYIPDMMNNTNSLIVVCGISSNAPMRLKSVVDISEKFYIYVLCGSISGVVCRVGLYSMRQKYVKIHKHFAIVLVGAFWVWSLVISCSLHFLSYVGCLCSRTMHKKDATPNTLVK